MYGDGAKLIMVLNTFIRNQKNGITLELYPVFFFF